MRNFSYLHLRVLLGTFCWIVLSLSFSASISLCLSPPTISKATASGGTKTTAAISSDDCQHYKWLIIGGGIHGVGIASRLVGEGKIERNDHQNELLLVDEHSELLYSWKERTSATGMTFLRSAVGFHLDLPAQGLKTFASNAKANANANNWTGRRGTRGGTHQEGAIGGPPRANQALQEQKPRGRLVHYIK
mmetsp:Transcript_20938/g.49386  ORF Transcript_20938/g.49386 Transcript_20938/m.49386 type:complete len:191 (-) Transcript_20938:258-830(-)